MEGDLPVVVMEPDKLPVDAAGKHGGDGGHGCRIEADAALDARIEAVIQDECVRAGPVAHAEQSGSETLDRWRQLLPESEPCTQSAPALLAVGVDVLEDTAGDAEPAVETVHVPVDACLDADGDRRALSWFGVMAYGDRPREEVVRIQDLVLERGCFEH